MKKSSFNDGEKKEGLILPGKAIKYKHKGIIYKIDWHLTTSTVNHLSPTTEQKSLNLKNDIT